MLVLMRGAGDIATGVALRLMRAGFSVAMTELPVPSAIRRTVAFSEAMRAGMATVEGVTARFASSPKEALCVLKEGGLPVFADPALESLPLFAPGALVDAALAKRNLGVTMKSAPIVVGLGPGFTAGVDCHAAIETMRGHDLGRVYYEGAPMPNTGMPGEIGGQSGARLLRAPASGLFCPLLEIGATVAAGDVVATVNGIAMRAAIPGVLRGLLPPGFPVTEGMKSGDIDPRGNVSACFTVSDKARSIGGAALEAILHFAGRSAMK